MSMKFSKFYHITHAQLHVNYMTMKSNANFNAINEPNLKIPKKKLAHAVFNLKLRTFVLFQEYVKLCKCPRTTPARYGTSRIGRC